jgi:hypothetical protein
MFVTYFVELLANLHHIGSTNHAKCHMLLPNIFFIFKMGNPQNKKGMKLGKEQIHQDQEEERS